MSLFPLPAIIFLCCLILLLVLLTVLYFTVLKKDLCFPIGGSGGAEEGEDALLENGKGTTDIPDGPAKIETQPTGDVTGEGGGGVEVPSGNATNGEARGSLQPATPGSDQVLTTPASEAMTNTQPAPSIVGATDSVSNVGDPVGFIEPEEPEPLSIAGKILIQFTYMPAANKVNLTVIRVGDMPPPDRGGSDNIQVHLCVLPMRKQRFRTKAVPVSKGVFNETFQFIHMTVDLVETCGIRLRVYGTQRFSKRLIGEVKVPLSQVDLTSPLSDEQIWKTLSPKGLVALYAGIDEEDEPDLDDW